MTRNEARETLMQIMYELDLSKAFEEEDAAEKGMAIVAERMSGSHISRCSVLLEKITGSLDEIDGEINKYSTKWKTTRMPKVDLAIMRLAVGEMKFADDTPHAVIINEAINIAKKYSTINSAKFIHGVLGAISKTYTGN